MTKMGGNTCGEETCEETCGNTHVGTHMERVKKHTTHSFSAALLVLFFKKSFLHFFAVSMNYIPSTSSECSADKSYY